MLFSIVPVPVSGNLSQPQTFDTFFIVLWLDSLSFKTTTQDANSFRRCSYEEQLKKANGNFQHRVETL